MAFALTFILPFLAIIGTVGIIIFLSIVAGQQYYSYRKEEAEEEKGDS